MPRAGPHRRCCWWRAGWAGRRRDGSRCCAAPAGRTLRLHGAAGAGPLVHPGADVRAGRAAAGADPARILRARRRRGAAGRRIGARPGVPLLQPLAWSAGSTGVLLHLYLVRQALATGMRQDLGRSFVLVKSAWAALLLALVLAGVLWSGLPLPHAGAWLALALVAWLLGMVLGFLQRILPFLAALHAAAGRRRGPTASSLTHERAPAAAHRLPLRGAVAAGAGRRPGQRDIRAAGSLHRPGGRMRLRGLLPARAAAPAPPRTLSCAISREPIQVS